MHSLSKQGSGKDQGFAAIDERRSLAGSAVEVAVRGCGFAATDVRQVFDSPGSLEIPSRLRRQEAGPRA